MKWSTQDDVRFISIPVPPASEGGVVDLKKGKSLTEPGADLIKNIEAALKKNYGFPLRRWIRYAWSHRERVNDLIEEFVSKVDVFSAHEGRVARKFGLVYAAGQIAVEAGFLKPWENKGVPLRVTRRLFELAISKIDEEPTKLVSLLAEALQNHSIIPVQKGRAVLGEGEPFIALRFRRSGKNFIGLRVEELSNLSEGLGGVRSITTLLNDILEKGHGGKRTQQLNVSICTEDGTLVTKKPRLLVVRRKKLEQFFSEQLRKPLTLGSPKADRKPQHRGH